LDCSRRESRLDSDFENVSGPPNEKFLIDSHVAVSNEDEYVDETFES